MVRERNVQGNIYHVLNRGVDGRSIFIDDLDRLRFISDLFEFNTTGSVNNVTYRFHNGKSKVFARPYIGDIDEGPRILLVEILAFVLMPNHYHLLLIPKNENGIMKFIKRLDMGYARYFNEKHKRRGALFEGRYKCIPVSTDAHFIHIPYYIHFNPLDLKFPEWRERNLKDYKKAVNFLERYRWSSHLDYLGKKNFPSVTSREFLLEFFGGSEGYQKSIVQWLKNIDSGAMRFLEK